MQELSNETPLDAPTTPRLHKADLHMLAVFMTVTECGGFAAAQVALNVVRRGGCAPIGAISY